MTASASALTVQQVAAQGLCATSGVSGLSQQIIEAQMCTGGFTSFVSFVPYPGISISSGVRPYAQASARDAIQGAARSHALSIISAYRTVADQYVLYHSGACGVAASPGRSNHQSGRAIDVQNHSAARSALRAHGCLDDVAGDAPHFDCPGGDLRSEAIRAFQHLWNVNHPGDRIAEDGAYGPITNDKLAGSPAGGFATNGCSPPPPPPPPPSCDDTAGGFTFSCDGVEAGQHCVSINEPDDPDTWSDNYLCSATDVGFVFSTSGPVDGMRCANLHEPADAHADSWADDYACVPEDSTLELAWSSAGRLVGYECVRWNEPADPGTWNDNYLCVRPAHCTSAGDFTFCNDGPVDGMACTLVNEPDDPDSWHDNYFCSAADIGIVWSHMGALVGMNCTAVTASEDTETDTWTDNYVCLPEDAPYDVLWSDSGSVAGMDCVRWYEPNESDAQGRTDDYLCLAPTTLDPDAGVDLDAGTAGDADMIDVDAGTTGDADMIDVDAGASGSGLTGGCGCRAAGQSRPTPWASLAFMLTLLGFAWGRSRRR